MQKAQTDRDDKESMSVIQVRGSSEDGNSGGAGSFPPLLPSFRTDTANSSNSSAHLEGGSGVGVMPRTSSEWELYALLFHANLLQYYSSFIAQGGDDVRQLVEAGDEEFLEIMALIGMAAKPLHVRRLQKTLHDLVENPSKLHVLTAQFQSSSSGTLGVPTPPPPPLLPYPSLPYLLPTKALQPWPQRSDTGSPFMRPSSSSSGLGDWESDSGTSTETPTLTDSQIEKISEAAKELYPSLPEMEPKLVQNKKKISPELLRLIESKQDSPERTEEFRKYAAIYGRFDKNRRPHKPLTLHEVSINEAATQLCLLKPPLLTRRDELFSLARQLIKDAQIKSPRTEGESDEGSLQVVEGDSSPLSTSQGTSPAPGWLSEGPPADQTPSSSTSNHRKKRRLLAKLEL